MLRTVAECDKALKLLEMERKHILEIRKYLEKNGPVLLPTRQPKPTTDTVLQIVLDHPGVDGQTVVETIKELGFELEKRQVQSALNRLSIAGEIENRGKHARGARWYVKEIVS